MPGRQLLPRAKESVKKFLGGMSIFWKYRDHACGGGSWAATPAFKGPYESLANAWTENRQLNEILPPADGPVSYRQLDARG